MNHPVLKATVAFLKKHRTEILILLLLAVLTAVSYTICREPAADTLLLPEWATKYFLFPVAAISALLTVLRRYAASLATFAGYHAGIVLAVVGTDPGVAHFTYARTVFLSVFLSLVIIGVWSELLPILLRRWQKEATDKNHESP